MEYWKNPRKAAKSLPFCFTSTPVLQYSITPDNQASFSTKDLFVRSTISY
jgi:hypothetical protein